jgi:4-hydroxybenzoate polyprenyltransferase
VAHPEDWPEKLLDLRLLLLSSSTIMIAAAGYLINDYYDVKIDYVNKPGRVVVGKLVKRRIVLAAHSLLNIIGIAVGFFLDVYIGLINLTAALLLWFYSNTLKHRPLIGNLTIAFLTGLTLISVAFYYQRNVYLLINYAIFAFSITLVREIIKDLEDIRGDLRFGSRTLPIIWGIRKTKVFLYSLIAIFVFLLFFLSNDLNNSVLNHFFLILIIPILHIIYLLYFADTQRKFLQLSIYCKLIMLAGILSMIFF